MKAFLILGSNVGKRQSNLKKAVDKLNAAAIKVVKQSSIYETEPIGYKEQKYFLNKAVEVETKFTPFDLLKVIKRIEDEIGRQPTFKGGPRVIDIDILLYNLVEMKSDELTIPHPRLAERAFVLKPLLEIAPDIKLPNGKKLSDYSIPNQKARVVKEAYG